MPKHVKRMLDDLQENGANADIKVIGVALDAVLDILQEDREEKIAYRTEREKKELEFQGEVRRHLLDTEAHTPKGILLRKDVVLYFVLASGLVSVIVVYIPEAIKWLLAL